MEKETNAIRYLTKAEQGQSRELWEEVFSEDSASFVDYYFTEKTKDNRILALEDEGRLASMLHRNPYQIRVKDCSWRVDYLVGVATKKECRHRGYMRRLLCRMMADMRAEQMPFCFLMPADEAIYRPFGFTYIYRQPNWAWTEEAGSLKRRHLLPQTDSWAAEQGIAELAQWLNAWLANAYQVYAVRDAAYLRRLLKELASENGTLDLFYRDNRLVGAESFWGLGERQQRLLYAEAPYVREQEEAKPAIMARIISPEVFLRAVSLKPSVENDEVLLILRLKDPLLVENDGVWLWHLNHTVSWAERTDEATSDNPMLTLTITELTAWLFGYDLPAAAVPYDDVVETLHGVFLDEVV